MFAKENQIKVFVGLFHNKGTKFTYQKGEYIIRPGETPSGVFYIETGQVKAFNISKYGEENLLIIRSTHEVFPLIWSIIEKERDIIYQALSETVVWQVNREEFISYLQQHNDALPPLLDMVTEMYRRHSERILNLEYRSVRERLMSFLLSTAGRFGAPQKDGSVIIEVSLKQQDIASSINASRETTSRELSTLERKGLLSNNNGFIVLLDTTKMQSLL